MTAKELSALLPTIPELPGCYQYLDSQGSVIYVGKAKNLRKRVASYFQHEHVDRKTCRLVDSIAEIKYFVVESESDALLLENNLIKNYAPKYNVLLKDGKSYPFIVITKEPYPRIFLERNVNRKDAEVYGPFTDVPFAHRIIRTLRELFKIRTCSLAITQQGILQKKYRPCLQYHIKRCKAPCIGAVSCHEYLSDVDACRLFLKGNLMQLIVANEQRMWDASSRLDFEEAQQYKEFGEKLRAYRSLNAVDMDLKENYLVFAFDVSSSYIYACMLHVREGAIIRVLTDRWKTNFDEDYADLCASLISQLFSEFPFDASELISNVDLKWHALYNRKLKVVIPRRGPKFKLLQLAQLNVARYKKDVALREEKMNPEQRATKLMMTMKADLSLERLPRHIECFDNSNIQGTHPVAACVVFRNGKPSKKEYKKFHVKTVDGPNDFASMKEIVLRRYRRVIEENDGDNASLLPDLIVIDGGKGQVGMAMSALNELGIADCVPLIGLAKNIEEIVIPGEQDLLYLKRDSETLRVLRHIRDEAHRFGITFHRKLRSKYQTHSRLDEIPGIGPRTKEKLLRHFGSVLQVEQAPLVELQEVVGKVMGERIYTMLHVKSIVGQLSESSN